MDEETRRQVNRENAQHSTGPQSREGKASSSQNARTHGILSRRSFLPEEDPAEYAALCQELISDLRPVGFTELVLVDRIATTLWRQQRLLRAEAATIEYERFRQLENVLIWPSTTTAKKEALINISSLMYSAPIGELGGLFSRYQTMLDNDLTKGLRALREAQTWRQRVVESNAKTVEDSAQT